MKFMGGCGGRRVWGEEGVGKEGVGGGGCGGRRVWGGGGCGGRRVWGEEGVGRGCGLGRGIVYQAI